MTSLPQPRLTQVGLEWVVVAGTTPSTLRGAFAFAADAVLLAQELESSGMRVNIGHTVFGWLDLLDIRQDAQAVETAMHEWAQGFQDDGWHATRYVLACTTGRVE